MGTYPSTCPFHYSRTRRRSGKYPGASQEETGLTTVWPSHQTLKMGRESIRYRRIQGMTEPAVVLSRLDSWRQRRLSGGFSNNTNCLTQTKSRNHSVAYYPCSGIAYIPITASIRSSLSLYTSLSQQEKSIVRFACPPTNLGSSIPDGLPREARTS